MSLPLGAIPLVDLKAQIAPLRAEIDAAIRGVVDEATFVLGPAVERFERAFASYLGVKHCVGVQSGTTALQLALLALGVGPGDEVVTSPMSFIATAAAITHVGARPVFCDIEPETLTLDPAKLEAAIGPRTKAIVPVHLYGQAADMEPILTVAAARKIPVLEDACQAHGATYRGRRVGGLGRAGCFSFYPGKNLGAFGEGGCVTTDDDAVAARVRLLRDHGSPEKYRHVVVGFNYRLEGLQGAVLEVKLRHLDRWNAARVRLARHYLARLEDVGDLRLPVERTYGDHVHHLFVVRSAHRSRILERFAERGIACAIHYPTPIHLHEAYSSLGIGPGSFPIAEASARDVFSLPLYAELSQEQQDRVIGALEASFS